MEFRILGPLEIRQNGDALPCKGAKQRLLLATLLLHANEVVSSDRLIGALWGEHPPTTATKALQVHVSQLRRLLEPNLLLTRPPGYELHLDDGRIDLQRFAAASADGRAALAAGRADEAATALAGALALWRGPPLDDLSYEENLQPEIARLEELRLSVLEDRIEADLGCGRHLDLIGELEQLAAQHPLRERIRGQLMLALYRSGRQAEALGTYRETRRLLVDELGLEPGRELKTLEQRILDQDQALDRSDASSDEPADGLLGRGAELAELLPIVDRALAGRGGIVLIGGEPGIGKSRLAETLARHAVAGGAQVAVGRCWEAGGAPSLWSWVQALRPFLTEDDRAALPELFADVLPAEPEDAPATRFRLFASFSGTVRRVAERSPLAIFLDDVHAADSATLLLLRFIAAELADAPVAVVCCYRETEETREFAETLTELSRNPVVHRIALRGLPAAATRELLAQTIGAPPADDVVARVHDETRGNPLFASEIGRLFATDGVPHDPAERLPIPEGVRDAIRQRLWRQSASCRETLSVASVVGREIDLGVLAGLNHGREDELSAALAEAGGARLLSAVPGTQQTLRFSHILVRDVLYDDLSPARRMQLHEAAAETISVSAPGNACEIAHHYLLAGERGAAKAIAYAQLAGDYARARCGFEEAADYYATAVRLVEGRNPPDEARVCELLLSLGDALSRGGRGADAKEALWRAADIAEKHGWPDQLASAALRYGGRFAWARASTDSRLVPLLERALTAVGTSDDDTRARLLARLAAASRDDTLRDRRVALANEAVELGRRSGNPTTLAYVLEGSLPAVETTDPAEGVAIGDELIAISAQLQDEERAFLGHDFRLHGLWAACDRAGVDVELEALNAVADRLGQPAHRWHVASHRTMIALMEGEFTDAERLIERTRRVGESAERWNAVVSARLQLFVLRRAQGRLGELQETIERSVHEYPALLRFRCALAHIYAAVGDKPRAGELLNDLVLARDLANEHLDAEWVFAIALLADPCRLLASDDAAAKVYDVLLPCADLYAEAPVEASFGATARGLGVLATTLGRFDDAERHFEIAVDIEQRMRARPWLAHAQHDLALMLLARDAAGDRDRATEVASEAVATYRSLGMGSWADRALSLV